MIVDGDYRLIGLKQNDITSEFDSLINSAKDLMIVCGYSFTKPSNRKSTLKKIIDSNATVKHCIVPIDLFRSHDINKPHAIELINNGVSVSLEPDNHSKWLMTENEVYFGSINFTNYSIEKRIEVAAFKKFIANDLLKDEFLTFTKDSMSQMRLTSNRTRIRGVMTKNQKLISRNKNYIKRFNPSIKKVTKTLDSISKVQSSINTLLANSYWLVDSKYYRELTRQASYYSRILNRVNFEGNILLDQYERSKDYDFHRIRYNEYCDVLINSFDDFWRNANDYIESTYEMPEYTIKNRSLILQNESEVKKIIKQGKQ